MKITLVAAILLASGISLNVFQTPWVDYLSTLGGVILRQTQGVSGNVWFSVRGSCGEGPIPPFWEPIIPNIELVVHPSSGLPITVHLNWIPMGNCAVRASFSVGLAPGTYSLDVTWCYDVPSCVSIINPITIAIEPNKFAIVDISANTKIH